MKTVGSKVKERVGKTQNKSHNKTLAKSLEESEVLKWKKEQGQKYIVKTSDQRRMSQKMLNGKKLRKVQENR